MQREMYTDKKFMAALEEAAKAPAETGGGDLGGGDLGAGGDLGGDTGGGDLDLGGDTGGGGGGGATGGDKPDAGGGDDKKDTDLLAEPPAKRDDNAKPRGPYKKRKITYRKGGFSKQMKNQAFSGEIRGSTPRTTWPGKVGFGGMDSLVRGMQEGDTKEEEKLFTIDAEIKTLLESLNKKGDTDET